ncbi:hypothetical protein MMC22_001779 [Lobaria immixta]|nr:hypothetical protein [Lobaria immixta]
MSGETRGLQVWWERIDAVLRGNVWIGEGKDTVEIDFAKASRAEPDRLLEFATLLATRARSLRVKVRFEHLILLALCDVQCWRGIPVQAMFRMMMERNDEARDLESFLKGGVMWRRKFTKELYMRGFVCDNRSLVIPWGRGLSPYSRLGSTYGESLDYYMRRLERPEHREKLPSWPEDAPVAQPYLIHRILLSNSFTCVQICQELGYNEDSLRSTDSTVRSTSNQPAHAEFVVDHPCVGEDKSSFSQNVNPRGAEGVIYRQVEGGRQNADILLEAECKEPISTHEIWDIDE